MAICRPYQNLDCCGPELKWRRQLQGQADGRLPTGLANKGVLCASSNQRGTPSKSAQENMRVYVPRKRTCKASVCLKAQPPRLGLSTQLRRSPSGRLPGLLFQAHSELRTHSALRLWPAARHLSHTQNPVLNGSTQNLLKDLRRRPQLFMVGSIPYSPSSTRVLIVAHFVCKVHLKE